jgi:hypothetical protein
LPHDSVKICGIHTQIDSLLSCFRCLHVGKSTSGTKMLQAPGNSHVALPGERCLNSSHGKPHRDDATAERSVSTQTACAASSLCECDTDHPHSRRCYYSIYVMRLPTLPPTMKQNSGSIVTVEADVISSVTLSANATRAFLNQLAQVAAPAPLVSPNPAS